MVKKRESYIYKVKCKITFTGYYYFFCTHLETAQLMVRLAKVFPEYGDYYKKKIILKAIDRLDA